MNIDSQSEPATTEASNIKQNSYGQALKSSAIIGGSTIINILIGIFRTKFMAVLLGPAGVGLMGMYGSILELAQIIAGMGINSSGVRQIAEAVGSEDANKIAKTAIILRRTAIFMGILGAACLVGFAKQLSFLSFGDYQQVNGIALLSLAVFFNLLSAAQGALIQGMRQISSLAKIGILGTLFGAIISILAIYYLGIEGIALSFVLNALMSLITSWWFRRQIKIQKHSVTAEELRHEQSRLLKLGFAFMASGLMMTGTAYLVRMVIIRQIGFDAAGLYQSAWTLGGLYIGFILQAMGTDFYPRLTTVVNQHGECNRMVNEQTHISLLLSAPGIIATLTFAPLVIELFYSVKFQGAVELLRWLCLGMTLRVVSWPMGFIIMAKGAQKFIIISELLWATIYLALTYFLVSYFGLNGVGIAFFGSYVFHVLINLVLARHLTGFSISKVNIEIIFIFVAMVTIIFYSYYAFSIISTMAIGTLAILLFSFYGIQEILHHVSLERVPRFVVKIFKLLRLTSATELNATDTQLINLDNTEKSMQKMKTSMPVKRLIELFIVVMFLACLIQWNLVKYNFYPNFNFHLITEALNSLLLTIYR